jgi:hypothetical protein
MNSVAEDFVDERSVRRVIVTCDTCGRNMMLAPSVAATRRFCNRVCFLNRPSATIAVNILKAIGGVSEVSSRLSVPNATVRHWGTHGIPLRYHLPIIKLAKEKGLEKGAVTLDRLLATTVAGREHRAARKNTNGDLA